MLLQSLRLKNIRSYQDQVIHFPPNSTLLAGDIGSGKSTLLLAIEFALFGVSKPDLTGETLLRKGAVQGSVELAFQLENKNIIIQRNLKKSKDAIPQTNGHLIINNLKKDLTPLELKAEIITLLGYPEDCLAKSKNYIFRYTLYTPQEEMKLILQEEPDSRLDILRRIFNLDKYKKIRENILFYLKEIRDKSAVLKARLEPLDKKKSNLSDLKKQEEIVRSQLSQLSPQLDKIKQDIETFKKQLKGLEYQNQLYLEQKRQLINLQNLLKEKQSQQAILVQKQARLKEKIAQLIISQPEPEIQKELHQLQEKYQNFLSRRSELTARTNHYQEQTFLLQKEISLLNQQTSSLEEKQEKLLLLEKELSEKEKIKQAKEEIEASLDQVKQALSRNQLLLSQAEGIKEKIFRLDQCPTCLQLVSEAHKKNLFQQEQKKIIEAETRLAELKQNKSELQKKILEISRSFESLLQKENQFVKLKTELLHLQEKQDQLINKKNRLQQLVEENNLLLQQLTKLPPAELDQLSWQLQQKQELLQKLLQKQQLENNLGEVSQALKEIDSQTTLFFQEIHLLEKKLAETPDLAKEISQQRQLLEEISEKEKSLLSEKVKLQTQQHHFNQQLSLLIEEIDYLNQLKSHLIRLTELHYWLDEFFIKLTYTIEKQVMVKIHHLFSQLFQEWFSILIADEAFSSWLDDSFTPVIEQNGYEIYFNHLSGGERTAASLSYRLALNKVINDIIPGIKTKSLLILDEPTEGFSSDQLDKIRDVLERLNLKQTIIVSHESKIESFVDNVLKVSKNEGVSQVI